MNIKRLDDLFEAVKGKPKVRLVAVNAIDGHSLEALFAALDKEILEVTVTGNTEEIKKFCFESGFDANRLTLVQAASDDEAGRIAAEMVKHGEANCMMKGLLSTDKFMRILLNKEYGLLPPKAVLSHVTVIQHNNYHKLLTVSDVAIIPYPDLPQKVAMARYLIQTAHALGVTTPKVAIIAATEQVLGNLPACTDAAIISKMAERGQIQGGIVDGPLALDVALDEEAANIKKVVSPVAGDADCLLFPNIDAGNVFYKMGTRLCNSEQAAIVAGATVPVVLSSRGDSMKTKLYSIALAALLS